MHLGRYRLLAQLGAGPDGAAYRAVDDAGEPAEVRVLSGASAAPARWKIVGRRLRLAAMLKHAAAVRLRDVRLDHDPPFAALEWVESRGLHECFGETAATPAEVQGVARDICEALAEAHHLGLAHGRLRPSQVRRTAAGALRLDFTGVDTGDPPGPQAPPELDASCRAPETNGEGAPDAAADLYGLGAVLYWLLRGRPYLGGQTPHETPASRDQDTRAVQANWQQEIPLLLAEDPAHRPPAPFLLPRLRGEAVHAADPLGAETVAGLPEPAEPKRTAAPAQVGRFRLLEKLGEGGMGSVYRAEDVSDGTVAAVKLLQGRWDGRQTAWRRLRKEARLLAEVNNPYVANLIEINEHEGVPYLVLEFVEGESLSRLLARRRRLTEAEAVSVMADVARALADAHRRGIVHRDVKPENILVQGDRGQGSGVGNPLTPFSVKLCDFGLARHVLQSASLNVTEAGTVVGTPFYASPEQCTGQPIDARTDVYAMGATLFHLLAGRPPFLAETVLGMTHLHANQPPPPLRQFNPDVSDGICRIIEKALAKSPDARHADAEALLLDLERLRRGEAVSAVAHPRLPPTEAAHVLRYDWSWELEAPPEALWPHVSNTERLNRAVGLPAVEFTAEPDPSGGARRFGAFRKAGVLNAWREHPFEWVEGRRLGVLREYSRGVFKWLASWTELQPRAGGGTTLSHIVRIEPRNLLGRFVAAVEVGVKGKRAVERVYRRIDAHVCGKLGRPETGDPFEPPAGLNAAGRRRLDGLLEKLADWRIDPAVVESLGEFLRSAPPQEVARIRPLALAERLGVDPEALTAACLHGAREGLLLLLWDILCPICRIPSGVKDALQALGEHEHCAACDRDFQPDFAESVEMIFRIHPQIRPSELGVYCIGGPAHSPHVAAQVRVAPGETVELELALTAGTYRLRGPQLPCAVDFAVRPAAPSRRWDVLLVRGAAAPPPVALQEGRQRLGLTNEHPVEVVVRVERTAPRADALTAARASTLALFRELFPDQALSPGKLAGMAALTLLLTDLDPADRLYERFGDARAFGVLHGFFQTVGEVVKQDGGAVVKTVSEGALASFIDPESAVRAALRLAGTAVSGLRPRVAVHRGPVMVATINNHLDYFGATVSRASRLPQRVHGGDVVLTHPVASDPQVAALLHARGLPIEVLPDEAAEAPAEFLHRIKAPSRPAE
ncbi:MAG TPA: protein kinase [Gemmataceae bacterium]|nr:protein kinase [Gemmataceae bacterium]